MAARLEAVELAFVDLDGDEEEREAVREDWLAFLGVLSEGDAQDAEERVQSFALLLDGLLRSGPLPDEGEAEKGGESA
jgi:hypothetical protein